MNKLTNHKWFCMHCQYFNELYSWSVRQGYKI